MKKLIYWIKNIIAFLNPPAPPTAPPDYLDTPLIYFAHRDAWTIRDATEGTQVFGAIGSGKTSGSGKTIATRFLQHGFGGLVLTAKKDERELWEKYCADCGRSGDLVIFSVDGAHRFNFMDFELNREGSGAGLTENLVHMFTTVAEIGSQSGKHSDPYWQTALKQLLRNAIDLISMAKDNLSVMDIYMVITSAASSEYDLSSDEWKKSSTCYQLLELAEQRVAGTKRENDFQLCLNFWLSEYPKLADKTRSIITSSFTGLADGFLRGTFRELFCTTTNISPEDCWKSNNKIILLDLPIKEFNELGQYAQVLFKLIWQKAVERRKIADYPMPVFLWADEAQFFLNSYDPKFQSTARASRACTVYLTQNYVGYQSAMGGDSKKSEVDAFLGNLQTKIFHANGEHHTNTWAADTIAKSRQFRPGLTPDKDKNSHGHNISMNEHTDYTILPVEFTSLKKGGPENNLQVQAIIFQGGRIWNATGKNYLRTTFKQ